MQAKHLVIAANKLIKFAKRAEKGATSPLNLLKGRVVTEQVMKKLLMETIPKLESIPQNHITVSRKIRRRRGDNAPMVHVTIRGSEKEDIVRMQAKEEK
jgi:ribosomal protein L17